MVLRVPHFYKEFQCLAGKCKDSCCIGWEIDIDPDTYAYYSNIEGEFGRRLQENIRIGRETSFILKEGRCPFLNEHNLCDICTELGEESLCEICTEYPRFTMEYGDVEEKCFGISCEEAGRLIFRDDKKITFEETVLPGDYIEDEEEDRVFLSQLEQARNHAIAIMQERSISTLNRISLLLQFAEQVQRRINENQMESLADLIEDFEGEALLRRAAYLQQEEISAQKAFQFMKQRMDLFDQLEVLDEEWRGTPNRLKRYFLTRKAEGYVQDIQEFMEYYKERDYEYEHLMVYFIFRYGMKAAFDYDFYNKIRFGVVSFLVIRDMDVERFIVNGRQFTKEDRIDVARIYSKEVEHSEDNLQQLTEDFMFEELFELYEINTQLLV